VATTNQVAKEATEETETVVTSQEAEAAEVAVISQVAPEKCTRQYVLTANRKQKYRSNHPVTGLYTAGNVSRITDHQESTDSFHRIH
jgi:peptidoglycan hydrolase-like protein with peptidoglycan-binding domain